MSRSKFLKAGLLGLAFGFLLQKGGVVKFHILVGALLLEDFVVVKVMLTAVVVGMLLTYWMRRKGLIELEKKPFHLWRTIVGGLVFGIGFAFSGYCPGTGAAALGQLNGDAVFMGVGMIVGSYIYALVSGKLEFGQQGPAPRLPDLVKASEGWFTVGFSGVLIGMLILLEALT